MGIIQRDGFNFYDGLNSDFIVVEDDKIEKYVNYILDNNIRSVAVNDLYYSKDNLDFLKECSLVEKVNIDSSSIQDFSGLHHLKNLKVLYMEGPKRRVDISLFKQLEELSIDFNNNVVGIEKSSNLKILRLWKYKAKSKNLEELSELTNLEELVITQSAITSLKGCGSLSRLKKLELNYVNKLEVIDEIDKNSNTLRELFIESCKNIKNHSCVSSLKGLEKLWFVECGDISSINFIRDMPKLKSFVFTGTNIIDGDISPCLGLEYVAFDDKKHFSHKMKDFK